MMDSKTPNLQLDYLLPEQAQKHVTVNDALRRLDGLVHLSVINRETISPPENSKNGARYLIADGAEKAWEGHDGALALYEDTGWAFIMPQTGWLLWDEAEAALLVKHQAGWRPLQAQMQAQGETASAGYIQKLETVFEPAAGLGRLVIPSHVTVLGVTANVLTALTGAESWQLGTAKGANRFGTNLAIAAGTFVSGPSDPPQVYWQAEDIVLTAKGGAFTGGRVAVAVHFLELPIPQGDDDTVTL